jgi:hypothetical protein
MYHIPGRIFSAQLCAETDKVLTVHRLSMQLLLALKGFKIEKTVVGNGGFLWLLNH